MQVRLNKIIPILSVLFLFFESSIAQVRNTSFNEKLSVNGFCLCKATINDLKKLENNLKEVNVEEMDLSTNCLGQDSRFVAGKGYYSDKYSGMIFQKDQESDFISKIRLTKDFTGKLPDGNNINMQNFLLKDLFKLYPQFKDQWHSRGCSNYWNFSNDTIEFYVKVDPSKQPQFPIDENYYMNKPVEAIDLILSCNNYAQDGVSDQGNSSEPLYFVNSIQVTKEKLKQYQPDDIAFIIVYKDQATIKKLGLNTTTGAFFIETKVFVKQKNWKYLSLKSKEYAKLVPTTESDSSIQYILNNKLLKDNSEIGTLNDNTFKRLKIIGKKELMNIYNINNKDFGVVITTIVLKTE